MVNNDYAVFIMCINMFYYIKILVYPMNDLCSSLFRQSRDLHNTYQSNINKHIQILLPKFPATYFL